MYDSQYHHRRAQLLKDLLAENPADHRTAFERGWYVLSEGDLQEGMKLLNQGRLLNLFGETRPASSRPEYYAPEHTLREKTLLLKLEGSVRDQIMTVRFAEDFSALGAKVTISGNTELAGLFARMPTVAAVMQPGVELGTYHDYWIQGMNAVRNTSHTFSTLSGKPYFKADSEYLNKWGLLRKNNEHVLRVGIQWSERFKEKHVCVEHNAGEIIGTLRPSEGIKFFSFQTETDLKVFPKEIDDLQNSAQSLEDRAAALSLMDLVITPCTTTAHLAAALGIETWILVPYFSCYAWAHPAQELTPWYSSVRLFRQQTPGQWNDVAEKLARALEERASQKAIR